jgi:hypothetical protein
LGSTPVGCGAVNPWSVETVDAFPVLNALVVTSNNIYYAYWSKDAQAEYVLGCESASTADPGLIPTLSCAVLDTFYGRSRDSVVTLALSLYSS